MKKFTAILVCLLLVASLAVMAFAAEEVKYTLTADKTSVSRGDVVTYTISTNNIDNCKGVAMLIDYDKAVFEYVENSGTNNAPAGSIGFVSVSNNKLACSMTNLFSTFSISGDMFTLQLKVLDAAAFADSQVAIGDASYTAADKTTVAVEGNSVKMSIVCANHTPVTTTTKEATCKEAGEKVTTCSVCNEQLSKETVAKLPHTPVTTTTKEATCKEAGEKVTTCSVCNEQLSKETVAKLLHTPVTTTTKEATCKEAGEKVTSCSVCNEQLSKETVAKLPHTPVTTTTKEATCKEAGEKVTSCSVCNEVIKTEEIAKLPHTLGEFTETKAPTCAAEGEKTATCSVCNETVTEAIEKLEHTWDEGKVTTEPTTKKEGVKTYTCTVCGETKTEAIAKLETPKTDDNSMIIPFVLLMVLSAAGVAVTVIGKKRVA